MYVAIALVGLFLVWAVAVQVGARRQEVAVVSLSGPEAQAVVQSVLGGKRFQWVEGPGQVNAKPRLKWRAPTISVDVEPRTDAYGYGRAERLAPRRMALPHGTRGELPAHGFF